MLSRWGPESAGAVPGPVCYGGGGTTPTVTDADVVLGFLDPALRLDEGRAIDAPAARRAIQEQLADPLGLALEEAAWGVFKIANAHMIRAIKNVTTERGLDPRQFCLFAFGGCGPVHAAHVARDLNIQRVVVPQLPGLFSAFGLLFAKNSRYYAQSVLMKTDSSDRSFVEKVIAQLRARAIADLRRGGFSDAELLHDVSFGVRYRGQRYHLAVPVRVTDDNILTAEIMGETVSSFHIEHDRHYGRHDLTQPTEIVSVRIFSHVDEPILDISSTRTAVSGNADGVANTHSALRRVYFGPEHGWIDTPVLPREAVVDSLVDGPMIVDDFGATIIVPPDASLSRNFRGDLEIVFPAQAHTNGGRP